MRPIHFIILIPLLALVLAGLGRGERSEVSTTGNAALASPTIERVTTRAPFPRGLVLVDDQLLVLCRGRVRSAGGVSAEIDDQAGTIYVVDPNIAETIDAAEPSPEVQNNGEILARPTAPPFRLWNRHADPPESDRETDRPYCTLRYHDASRNLFICAFSGVDKNRTDDDPVAFSKNLSDAILRYDLRSQTWSEVERHDIERGGSYPHHDPARMPPPHGWLNGPDNCLVLGDWLYAVSKDNSLLVRYDLRDIITDPDAGPPNSEVVSTGDMDVERHGRMSMRGQSALAYHDGWLYIAFRTTSEIVRLKLDDTLVPVQPLHVELVARFDPYDPTTGTSADLTDMSFDDAGRLYVISAQPARIYRFQPNPRRVFDARSKRAAPWIDLAQQTDQPKMKSENLLCHGDWVYVTSGDGYGYQAGAEGTVYRVRIDD